MSFSGKISHLNTWNYCSTCFTSRTECPNGTKCESCRRKTRRRLAPYEHKKAQQERERLVELLWDNGMHEAAVLIKAHSPNQVRS
jgi:hypothetical protein